MKVKATPQIQAEIARLAREQELDARINMYLTNYVDYNAIMAKSLEVTAQSSRAEMGQVIAENARVVADAFKVCRNAGEQQALLAAIARNGRVFSAAEYRKNPYLTRIDFEEHALGRYAFTTSRFEAFQLINYDMPRHVKGHFFAAPAWACFDGDFRFPCFMEGKSAWMSVTPNEIFTMEKPVKEARGRVLTLGCGMGYYAYMVHLKDTVEHVTVVELEPRVIELFEEHILPQFDYPEKIEVVRADAYAFMEQLADGEYAYCFADTWIGGGSVTEYLRMREACRHLRRTKGSYWIESSFLNALLRLVAHEIADGYEVACNRTPAAHPAQPIVDGAKDYIRELLEDSIVATPAAIARLMDPDNLLKSLDRSPVRFVG